MAGLLNLWESDPPAAAVLERGAASALNLWENEPGEEKKPARRGSIPGTKKEKLRGPVSELASALGAGVVQTMEGIAGTAEMLGVPGGETARKEWQRIGQSEALRRPEYLEEGDVVSDPGRLADWRWWVRSFGENLPNMAAMYLPGVGAARIAQGGAWGARAIRLFGQNLSAARIAGLGGLYAGSFTLEAGGAYGTAKDEMTREGILDPETIERIATMEGLAAGATNALIELLPFDNLFLKQAGADRLIKRMVRQAFIEGTTEAVQEGVNIYVEKLGHKPDQGLTGNIGRVLESALIGGMLGGFAGGTVGTAVQRGNIKRYEALGEQIGLTTMVVNLKEAGVADKEIARQVEKRIGELRGEIDPADEARAAVAYALTPGPDAGKEAAQKGKLPEIDAEEMTSYLLYATGRYEAPADFYDKIAGGGKHALRLFGIGRKRGEKAAAGAAAEKTARETGEESAGREIVEPGATSRAAGEIQEGKGEEKAAGEFLTPAPGAAAKTAVLTPGPVAGKDAATDENRAQAEAKRKKAENRQKGDDLFTAALADMTREDQERLEARKRDDDARRAAEDENLAAETEAESARAVAAAANEARDISVVLAGEDPKKQAIVGEVLGMSDRVVAGAVRTELGIDVQPAGLDRWEIVSEKGAPQAVTIAALRKSLAEKRINDIDAAEAARQKDMKAVRKREAEAKAKKETETETWALEFARQQLSMGNTLSRRQYERLQAARAELTPREVERLDAGPPIAAAEPPRSLQALGVRAKAVAVEKKAEEVPAVGGDWVEAARQNGYWDSLADLESYEKDIAHDAREAIPAIKQDIEADLAAIRERIRELAAAPEEDRAAEENEDRARGYFHDLLMDTIEGASESATGWVETEEGGRRIAAGGWISAVVKTFGREATTPLKNAQGAPQTLHLSKKYLMNVVNRARAGEELTEQQEAVYQEILKEAREEKSHAYTLAEQEAEALAEFVPEELEGEEREKRVIPYAERPPEEKEIINAYNKKMDSEEWIEAYEDEEDMRHFAKEEGHSPLADELIKDLEREGIKKGAKIAEIGSGQGRDAVYLAKKGHEVSGIDVSDKAVAIATENAKDLNATFAVGDAERLPFEDASQDAVYSVAALHGTPIKFTFAEIFRVLKPGGQAKMFLYTRTKTGSKWISYWTPGEIKQYAEENGFKVEKFREGHDTDPIPIPGIEGLVEQETHLVVTTLRKPKTATVEEKKPPPTAEKKPEAATKKTGEALGADEFAALFQEAAEEVAAEKAPGPAAEEKKPEAAARPVPSRGVLAAVGRPAEKKAPAAPAAASEEAPSVSRPFKIGDMVRPKTASGIPASYAGRIEHITGSLAHATMNSTIEIRTENSGRMHFHESGWELAPPAEEKEKPGAPAAGVTLSPEQRSRLIEEWIGRDDWPGMYRAEGLYKLLRDLGFLSKATQKIWDDAREQKDPNRDYEEAFSNAAWKDLVNWSKSAAPLPEESVRKYGIVVPAAPAAAEEKKAEAAEKPAPSQGVLAAVGRPAEKKAEQPAAPKLTLAMLNHALQIAPGGTVNIIAQAINDFNRGDTEGARLLAAKVQANTATDLGFGDAIKKPGAAATAAGTPAKEAGEVLPDLTVTGQQKPVPGHPEAGYVVHRRPPDLIPDTFKVILSRQTPYVTIMGTGMDAASAYRSALTQYEQKLAQEAKKKPAESKPAEPKKVEGAEFQEGDRVVINKGRGEGRHGAISKVESYTMRALFFGAGKDTSERRYSYTMKSDAGTEYLVNPEQVAREEGQPPAVVPDVEIDGRFYEPSHAHARIRYAKDAARKHDAAAQRARKRENIQEHQRDAQRERDEAARIQAIFDAWAARYPEAAQAAITEDIGPAKKTPSAGVALAAGMPAGQAAAGTAAPTMASAAKSLADLGLQVKKTTTNTGKAVWEVSGNTREHSEQIKKAGGRWYGPKKVWSFYNGDPTAALTEALGIRAEAERPAVSREKIRDWMSNERITGRQAKILLDFQQAGELKDFTVKDTYRGKIVTAIFREGRARDLDEKGEWSGELYRPEEDKPAQFVKGDKVIVQHGDKTYPATVLRGGLGSSSVSPDLTMKQAADLDLGSIMLVENDKLRAAPSLGKAAEEVAAGVASSYDAIAEIMKKAGKGPISMMAGGVFDEELYAAIKPHLQASYDHFRAAAIELKEWMKETIRQFAARGIAAADLMPYLRRFYDEAAEAEKGLTKGETGVKLESQEGGEPYGTAPDTAAHGGRTAQDDRAGAQGPGAAVAPGAEGGREAPGVPERPRTGAHGELRPGGRGTPLAGTGPAGAARLPGAGAGMDYGGEPALGGGPGGLAGVQRPAKPRDHRIAGPGDLTRTGSWIATAKTNLDIIALVKEIEREGRPATPDEQRFIARYTGFGASEIRNKLFEGYAQTGELQPGWADKEWRPLIERLQELLTEEEIRTAARSTQYAHYTSGPVVEGIYRVMERLGFAGGKFLEPGMGIGHFWGLMPETLRGGSSYTGVEMDHLTAAIARVLYPEQNVVEGDYTRQAFPNDFFDAAVGNPPFSKTQVLADPDYKKERLSLHNYFFVKTLDKLRPGGLLAFVTSRYTMDAQESKARELMAARADLIGAIRLPDTAFLQNAGTEVVTDIIILRKRAAGETPAGEKWTNLARIEIPERDGKPSGVEDINEYYAAHPEMVLGSHSLAGKMYRELSYTVKPTGELAAQLAEAAGRLPENVYSPAAQLPAGEQQQLVVERDFNPANKKEGGLYVAGAKLMKTQDGAGVPFTSLYPKFTAAERDWLVDYCRLRDALKQAQYDQLKDGPWEESLQALNEAYDRFVFSHGQINEFTLRERRSTDEEGNEIVTTSRQYRREKLLKMDVEAPLVGSLEMVTEEGEILPGPFLRGRTIRPPAAPEIRGAADALAVTLDEAGKLDLDRIAARAGLTRTEAIAQLGDLIYDVPGTGHVLADEYLSGDVVRKLEEAKAAAAADPKYARNVEALQRVQPQPLAARDVTVALGGNWIPLEYYDDFAAEVLEIDGVEVNYRAANNEWSVDVATETRRRAWGPARRRPAGRQSLRGSASEWGTGDRGANELLNSALNARVVRITRRLRDGSSQYDAAASTACNDIIKRMRESFATWVWEDAERTAKLLNIYNRKFNNLAGRRFDGRHMSLPGLSLLYKLHDHQKRAIWRIVQTGNAYLAHAVGAGKTLEMICAGMEMRRLGQIKKPLYVVPNHMLRQFSTDFQAAYPLAHVMIADEENFGRENRRRFVAQATMNNPDAIVLTHSAFGLLKVSEATVAPVRDEIVAQLRETLAELVDENASRARIQRIEQQIEQVEQRFAALTYAGNRDDVVNFEEMGVDYLFVDEAHLFRKLDYVTNRQIKGIDPAGSTRAMDLYIKTKWLEIQRPARSHTFASGTPITNTIAELYTLMRFFVEPELRRDDLGHFDAWANLFGVSRVTPEMNAAGRYEQVERFSEFINIPELMSRVRQFMDILTPSQLGGVVELPAIRGGRAEIAITPASEALKNYQRHLEARIQESRDWRPSPAEKGNPDPLINIITDGRLASIDMRYVAPGTTNDPRSKLNTFLDGIIASWQETRENEYTDPATGKADPVKGGSIVAFYNHGFGASVVERRGFDARGWAMQRFREAGIPAAEVGWIDDADTAVKKEALFKEVRQGRKRILIGSAKRMGTGMNVQRRLAALHYLDPPWYPADVEQPDGRIVRQGNLNKKVALKRYATQGSYDATMWQMVARKSRFTEQAFLGDPSIRKLQDLSETSQYELAAALASGDERVIRLANLRADLERLNNLQWSHGREQSRLHGVLAEREARLADGTRRIRLLKEAHEKAPGYYIREIDGQIGVQKFDNREEFGRALIEAYNKTVLPKAEAGKEAAVKIAEIEGFELLRKATPATDVLVLRLVPGLEFQLETTAGMTHEGISAQGLATRIVNQINGISTDIRALEDSLDEDKKEIAQARKRIGAPFASERELIEKTTEVAQLEAELVAEGRAAEEAARRDRDPNAPPAGEAPPAGPVEQDLAALHPADGGAEISLDTGEVPGVRERRGGYYGAVSEGRGALRESAPVLTGEAGRVPAGRRGLVYPEHGAAVIRRETVSRRKVENDADAAAVGRDLLAKYAQENLISLVLDKDGKILHVYHHTIGLKDQSQIDPGAIAGQALNTPGAAAIYLVHNHPSGDAPLSPQDVEIFRGLQNLLEGTGLEAKDILAVTPSFYASTRIHALGENVRARIPAPAEKGRGARIPLVERVILKPGEKQPHFRTSEDAFRFAQEYLPEGGLVFMTSGLRPVSHVALEDFKHLRGEVQTALIRQIEKANASQMIAVALGRALDAGDVLNLSKFAQAVNVPLYDVIDRGGESWQQEKGLPEPKDKIFYNLEEPGLRLALDGGEIGALVRGLVETVGGISAVERGGETWIETADGRRCRIMGVERIDADTVAVSLGYGAGAAKRAAVGSFTPVIEGPVEIRLVRGQAGNWTINHEFWHWLEWLGAISNPDKHLVDRKIASLIRKDPATYGRLRDLSAPERRATWGGHELDGMFDATTPTGKIIQKIKDVLDRILNALGIRTAGGVVRDIRTGRLLEGEAAARRGGIPGTRRAAGQYALGEGAEEVAAGARRAAGQAGSRALGLIGARMAPETRAAAAALAKHWKEFWRPFSTVPDGDKILARRYEAMGNVAKAVRFVQGVFEKLDAYPDQVKKDMFWYLNGDIPLEVLPEEAREQAEMIRRRFDTIGQMLVDKGILAQGQYDKYKGRYIHYLYAKHILGEKFTEAFLTSTGKLNLTYARSRKDLTLQQRKELGLIEDASVAVPVGMGKALTDLAKADYLETIAENADWVWQPSLVKVPIGKPLVTPIRGRTRRNVTMGIGKLVEEVKVYDRMAETHSTPEVLEIRRLLREALDQAEAASENMPADFVQLPTSKGYGALAGAYVRKPIADDLMPVLDIATDRGKLFNIMLEIERMGMATFKMGKVAVNLPTAVRNIISNIIQMNMRGRPLAKIPGDIVRALEEMKAKGEYYEEAFGMGLFHTNWFVAEINDVLDEFRKVKAGRLDQLLIAVRKIAKYYGKIDDVAKLAIFIEQRQAGRTVDEATLEAMKWGMDYSLASRSIKGLRQTIMPFATYQYKIAPLIAESLAKRPWVLAKFGMIYALARAMTRSLHDLDDDDWEDLEKQLPAYIKKSGSMMILPWKTDKGQWQWVNLEYYFPWGNYLAIARDMKEADLGEALRDFGVSNPFLSMFYTGLSAREDQAPLHAYFGTPIYNQLDPGWMKAAKLLEYMGNTWMPSMATRQGAAGYTGKALADTGIFGEWAREKFGGEDRWGREVTAGQALGRWFGANIISVSPEQTRAQASVRIQEKRKELARIEADPSYSEAQKEAYRARLNEELAGIAEEAPAAVLPITKAKGADPVYEALKEMAAAGALRTGPPSRSVEIAGVPLKMTNEQYGRYLEASSEAARRKLLPLVGSAAWEKMSAGRKGETVARIVAAARKGARQRIKAEVARENREKIAAARAAQR